MNVSSTDKQRKYLIAIGSPSCSEMGLPRLNEVEADIQRVENLLINEEQGYERVLADSIYISATSDRIKDGLTTWFTNSDRRNSDCVIIYYAGHASEGREQYSHYLYTVESNQSNLPNTVIETSDLIRYLLPGHQNSPQNILLILDVCYAGQGAANVLVESLTNNRRASENISFSVIASADSRTEAGDGNFVDAFEKVMKDSDWMSRQGEFLKLDDLVDHINEFLNNGQKAELSVLRQLIKLSFFRNSCYSSSTQRKSREQIIADCLLSLDYCHQEKVFTQVMEEHQQKAIAFLIQTDEVKIQNWLVGRLARCVSDFDKAKRYQILTRRHEMLWDFDALWREFEQDIGIGNKINRETVIQVLAEFCHQKSVIIAIYGLSRLTPEKMHQFHDFWLALVEQVVNIKKSSFRSSHLVLLLAEENRNDVFEKLTPFQFGNDLSSGCEAIHLTPLENFSQKDVIKWLKKPTVYDSLKLPDDEVQSIVEKVVPKLSEKPLEMLEDICCDIFKMKQEEISIAAIEPYWKLAG